MTSSGDAPVDPLELDIGPRAVIASRYEILSPLGAGGMGWVFKARDRILGETVALKVLRSDLGLDAERTERFRSEIRFARRVRHKNVCGLHEYGEDGNLHYIAMEYVEGSDLKQVVEERGPLPWDDAYGAAVQCAEGLAAIHEMGIIHRDIKTANITQDRAGVIRLMDFGIAMEWWGSGGAGVTGANPVVGTPEYMSPEQVRGQALDFRSDLYSLGVVVYELFTGQVPFRGETPLATMLKHFADEPSFTGTEGDLIPAPLVPLLRRALAKQPEGRPDSAREMADALKEARIASGPQVVRRASDVPRPRRRRGHTTQTLNAPPFAEVGVAPKPVAGRGYDEPPALRPSLPSLLAALTHADRDVRAGAAHGLGRVGPEAVGAVGALVRSLKDPSSAVRAQAAHALRKIGTPAMGAVVPLIEAMKDDHGYVRDAAAWAVAELTALPLPPGRLKGAFLRVPTGSSDSTPGVTLSPHATAEATSPPLSPPHEAPALRPASRTGTWDRVMVGVMVGVLVLIGVGLAIGRRGRPWPAAPSLQPSTTTRPEKTDTRAPPDVEPRHRVGAGYGPPGGGPATAPADEPSPGRPLTASGEAKGPTPTTGSAPTIPYGALVGLSEPGVSAPVPTLAPRPRHPDAGHRAERTATVEVRILVDEEGRVSEVEWVSGPPEWQASVGADLRHWTYRPASLQGVPVKVYLSLSFGFGASDS